MSDTDTKWVLVTGASRGIGRAIATRLASRGDRVIGVARTAPVDAFPGEFCEVDLSKPHMVDDVLGNLARRTRIDMVVNNAGINGATDMNAFDAGAVDDLFAANVRSTMQVTSLMVPGMVERGFGRIVNIASRAMLGKAGKSGYAASKAAIVGLTRSWALDYGRHGVTVNAVAPGPIATDMWYAPTGGAPRQLPAGLVVQRVGLPEEVAEAVAYFSGPLSGFTTGQVIYVCGGLSIGSAPS